MGKRGNNGDEGGVRREKENTSESELENEMFPNPQTRYMLYVAIFEI